MSGIGEKNVLYSACKYQALTLIWAIEKVDRFPRTLGECFMEISFEKDTFFDSVLVIIIPLSQKCPYVFNESTHISS